MFNRYNLQNLRHATKNPELILREVARPIRPIQHYGWRGVPLTISGQIHRHFVRGEESTVVWERDWDLLVILDACRASWLELVAPDYPFLSNVDSIYSVGSHSDEWIQNTFDEKYSLEIERCTYITANHHAEWIDGSKFENFEDVTKYNDRAPEIPAPPAHIVTDRAVDLARNSNCDKLIVHYMQPHKPFLEAGEKRREVSLAADWSIGYEMYRRVFRGELTKEELEEGFINNLQYVLSEVSVLLNNVDASKVAITADHGNALGERFLWDHSKGVKHPAVRRVPWAESTAEDKETIEPNEYSDFQRSESQVKEQLKQLGYH